MQLKRITVVVLKDVVILNKNSGELTVSASIIHSPIKGFTHLVEPKTATLSWKMPDDMEQRDWYHFLSIWEKLTICGSLPTVMSLAPSAWDTGVETLPMTL